MADCLREALAGTRYLAHKKRTDLMIQLLIKTAIRTKFFFTTRKSANDQAQTQLDKYLLLAEAIDEADGRRMIKVPSMPGIDPDMRDWSFYMILEHNAIVNRSITAIVQQLAHGLTLSGAATINPKTDVMPGESPGPEQVTAFATSITQHMETVSKLGKLRGTHTSQHPIFGHFDAHMWHCMFAIHLSLHLRQAVKVMKIAKTQA